MNLLLKNYVKMKNLDQKYIHNSGLIENDKERSVIQLTLKHLTIRIRSSFWYIPSLYGVFAILLALLSVQFDQSITSIPLIDQKVHSIFFTDIGLARTILSTISASLLTMTTITFSTILLVLTTFLSEFSPRTLQNFISDHSTQRVLGIFVGGFIYSILLLLFLKDTTRDIFIVPSFAVFLSIICLIVFVFFIHHVSNWMQVSNLIHRITVHVVDRIDQRFQLKSEAYKDAPWEDWESEELRHISPKVVKGNQSGYIKYLDLDSLIKQAIKDDCIVKVERKEGDYVDEDTAILSIWKVNNEKVDTDFHKFISIGREQSPIDQLDFGLTKIVEIALRALSPGVNDPNTAINCIDHLGRILTKLGKKHLPTTYHNDRNRNLRVMVEQPTFEDYLMKCFYPLRKYGFQDASILCASLKALTIIAEKNDEIIKEHIWSFSKYIIEGIDKHSLFSLDMNLINTQLKSLSKATVHHRDFSPL